MLGLEETDNRMNQTIGCVRSGIGLNLLIQYNVGSNVFPLLSLMAGSGYDTQLVGIG
jgi:hypothetical protein